MGLKRCPRCGEEYSDTYKECPFCAEDELEEEQEEQPRQHGRLGSRKASHTQPYNIITPTLIILIVLMAALLVYLLFGDKFSGHNSEEEISGLPIEENISDDAEDSEQADPPMVPESPETSGDGVMPDDPSEVKPPQPTPKPAPGAYEKANSLPSGLTLSSSDFSLFEIGETAVIRVSGGSGNYTWVSQDPNVATVDSTGKVTAVSGGTVDVVVSDGSKKGVCVVRVKAEGTAKPSESGKHSSGGTLKLNREDMTLKVDGSWQLKVSGASGNVDWATSDSSIVSVTGNGTVKGHKQGMATITASCDGSSVTCIVRVK